MARAQGDGREVSAPINPATLRECSALLGIGRQRLEVAVEAARLEGPEFELIEELLRLVHTTSRPLAVRELLVEGLQEQLEVFWTEEESSDPLADVDDPMDQREAIATALWADVRKRTNRIRLLQESISASQAGALTGRSRQAVERQRKAGDLIGLRSGREWRYPKWQFDEAGPAGLVPCLTEVIRALDLSPFGAALWLTTPSSELGDEKPIEVLRRRKSDPVLRLALEHGHML